MGEVLDMMGRAPRGTRVWRYEAHHVDLRFLTRTAESIFLTWTAENGDVPTPLPEVLDIRVREMLARHVQDCSRARIYEAEDGDGWAVCFTATGDLPYAYSFKVGAGWGQAH